MAASADGGTAEMIPIAYCRGGHLRDNHPTLHEAPDFDGFVAQILALPRARSKETRTYICGPMRPNGDGRAHRGEADLLPRAWLALDLDGGSREDCDLMLLRLADYQAITWTTARHVQECPRVRIVLALDREVNGPEGERLRAALVGVVGSGLPSLKWDKSTHRGEQECFLPMAGADVMRYHGDPIDVDAVLALAPTEPLRARPATPDPYQALIIERGLFLREIDPGKDAITCPFAAEHSEQTSGTATAYLWPLHNGHRWGKIHCFHEHCSDRKQEDYIRALGAEPRDVWRGQAGSAPYDDLPPVEAYDEDTRRPRVGGNSKAEHWDKSGNGKGAGPAGPTEPEWPAPMGSCAYYGLVGEMVKAVEPHSESDPAALLVQILAAFGVLVGRIAYYPVEGDRHYSNLDLLLVGGTSKGRKGTSWGRVHSIFGRAPRWPRVVSGLSSGEGLKWLVRDPGTKTVKGVEVTDEGVHDKRLLVIEPEFGSVLRVVARKGNTLSATVRSAWDTGYLSALTKHDRLTATDTHISIIGHITVDELRAELTQTDTANGFANRFLFLCVKRSRCLPRGGRDLPEGAVQDFVSRLDRAACLAQKVGAVDMTEAGWEIWDRVYPDLSEGAPGLFGAATARAEAQVVRLAMIYALLDEKAQIDAPHLLAALAVWKSCEASARYVFGSSLGDPVADEILRAVRAAGQQGMNRTQISGLFQRHCPAGQIGAALDLLARRNLLKSRSLDTGGRPSEVWVQP